jgi:hypothetical protein
MAKFGQSKLACKSWPHSLPPLSLSSRTLFLSHQFRAPLPSSPGIVSGGALINDVLTDDVLHAVLARLVPEAERDAFGLVCRHWLRV